MSVGVGVIHWRRSQKALSLRPARLLPGFRRYDRIVETLIHELAHMVHGDHDDAFKQLNSQLRAEAAAADWRGAAARRLEGAGPREAGRCAACSLGGGMWLLLEDTWPLQGFLSACSMLLRCTTCGRMLPTGMRLHGLQA